MNVHCLFGKSVGLLRPDKDRYSVDFNAFITVVKVSGVVLNVRYLIFFTVSRQEYNVTHQPKYAGVKISYTLIPCIFE